MSNDVISVLQLSSDYYGRLIISKEAKEYTETKRATFHKQYCFSTVTEMNKNPSPSRRHDGISQIMKIS